MSVKKPYPMTTGSLPRSSWFWQSHTAHLNHRIWTEKSRIHSLLQSNRTAITSTVQKLTVVTVQRGREQNDLEWSLAQWPGTNNIMWADVGQAQPLPTLRMPFLRISSSACSAACTFSGWKEEAGANGEMLALLWQREVSSAGKPPLNPNAPWQPSTRDCSVNCSAKMWEISCHSTAS